MAGRATLDRLYVAPMKALSVAAVPRGDWRLELKFDGYRAIATIAGGKAELWSRNRNALGTRYPALLAALATIPGRQLVLDGEIVALDASGRPSFQQLQQSTRAPRRPVYYYAFDLLRRDGKSLLARPLEERQRELERVLRRPPTLIRLSEVFDVPPKQLLALARKHGWEGIIAKDRTSSYEPDRRSGSWLKCKVRHEQEFVIGGYTAPRASRTGFGALLLGYHADGALVYAGKVGTGFSDEELRKLLRRLQREERARCPFAERPPERNATWVRPVLVCQVNFAEWTGDGRLRQASYAGLRDDKHAREVRREDGVATGS